MSQYQELILKAIAKKSYQPVKPKVLASKLGLSQSEYRDFRRALKSLNRQGQIEFGKNHTVRQAQPHGTVTGVFRKVGAGHGFVRVANENGSLMEVFIPEENVLDASSGDTVLVRVLSMPKRADRNPKGEIVQVVERVTRQFVGTYFERNEQGYVRVDGTVFAHSIAVGDPGAKGAKAGDKVVFEMVRFPEADNRRGEGVITEVLGPHGQPGVDTLSIIREFNLPDAFPEEALAEAREAAAAFSETDLQNRQDFTKQLTVTIDPVDARDFDDAVSVEHHLESGHWTLTVHIADVGHFAPFGGELDREARKRATSVYLPQKVIPMFPEIISNNLASLQQGRVRYVKTAIIEFGPEGEPIAAQFANGAICVRKRFTYEQVMQFLEQHAPAEVPKEEKEEPQRKKTKGAKKKGKKQEDTKTTESPRTSQANSAAVAPMELDSDVAAMLLKMRDLAMILRKRRFARGALELDMPETELEYDDDGKVIGAHFASHDVSHQMIEEFMLAANGAVAKHFSDLDVVFLRRIHPQPVPKKLEAFAEFAEVLGYEMATATDRYSIQRVLKESSKHPDMYAVHYALLRSLKQAVYSPKEEEHYALAMDDYCHFTSPIRRYPDLVIHRLLGQWLKTGKAGSDETELTALGDHCSKMERRADLAERELVKVKLLTYMSERLGTTLDAIITGVADYGFFAQAKSMPVEGLVRVATLEDDYYYFEESTHSLTGQRYGKRYRLGDEIRAEVVRVDVQRRQMDLRVVADIRKRKKKQKRS